MIKIKKHGIILAKTRRHFENRAVLNPAAIRTATGIRLYFRAVARNGVSCISFADLSDPTTVARRSKKPLLRPEFRYECCGIEDPRVLWIEEDGLYYFFYTAYDGLNARGAYAYSPNLNDFKKMGPITPKIPYNEIFKSLRASSNTAPYTAFAKLYHSQDGKERLLWEKDIFMFPKKINGLYILIHRVLPSIQIIRFKHFRELKSTEFWKRYFRTIHEYELLTPRYAHENRNIGGGAPPLEVAEGYLLIYHSVENISHGVRYHACAALLDKSDPQQIIGRLPYPLFSPTESWEYTGDVNNVVFPTGLISSGGRLYIYYGAADSSIAVASVSLKRLIHELISYPPKDIKNPSSADNQSRAKPV
ncbi:MAG: pesticidal protein Cry7Aa [Candidatus Uhrbacteria bacterium]|nr:pesticidal protein Cry7Aa [Candidatus Uhrbacteria bacterium]